MDDSYYKQRINCVIDFIEDNINKKLTLIELADVANFSKYHFHRIFKTVTGETLNNYIKRIKMEKIYRKLITHPSRSLTEIAFEMGYKSSANFSRDVCDYYKVSPSEIRNIKHPPVTRILHFDANLNITFAGIENISDKHVIYDRITTGYNPVIINELFTNLFLSFINYCPGLAIEQFIGIGYDDPDYTPLEKCRYDACISLNESIDQIRIDSFNTKKFKGGKYAVFFFEGKGEQIFPAWDNIFHNWLIKSEYIPDNRPHLEMYLPSERYKEGIFKVNLCLPIRKIK